jgi:hypothetical protein
VYLAVSGSLIEPLESDVIDDRVLEISDASALELTISADVAVEKRICIRCASCQNGGKHRVSVAGRHKIRCPGSLETGTHPLRYRQEPTQKAYTLCSIHLQAYC